jgi:hypothetical protein
MKRFALLALFVAAAAMAATSTDLTMGPSAGNNFSGGGGNYALGATLFSFNFSGTSTPYTLGCGRDANYIYGIFYGSPCFLRSYTTAGSAVGSVTLTGFSTSRGGSLCDLGAPYFAISDAGSTVVRKVLISSGSTISSFGVTAAGGGYLLDCGFNGTYYFAAGGSSKGSFNLYTTSGSSAGSWTASGASSIASTGGYDSCVKINEGTPADYVVIATWNAGGTNFVVTYPAGSAVGSFVVSGCNANGVMCGPCVTANHGTTLHGNWYTGSALNYVETDLGNTTPDAVSPASIGHIKALYR